MENKEITFKAGDKFIFKYEEQDGVEFASELFVHKVVNGVVTFSYIDVGVPESRLIIQEMSAEDLKTISEMLTKIELPL